jgi:phage baseplate assembly protein V
MSFLSRLTELQDTAKFANSLIGRNIAPYLAIVSNNNDPDNRRRIKVVNPANPQLETHWIRRLDTTQGKDEPLPKIGQTVLVLCIDGVDTNAFYLYCVNDTNPPLNKNNVVEDFMYNLDGSYTITADRTITLQTASGGVITVNTNGSVSVQSPSTVTLTAPTINITGNVSITGSSVAINGQQIATVGAPDSRGDVLTGKGW